MRVRGEYHRAWCPLGSGVRVPEPKRQPRSRHRADPHRAVRHRAGRHRAEGTRIEPASLRGLLNPYLSLGVESNARQSRPDPEEFAPDGYTLLSLGAGVVVPRGRTLTAVDLAVSNLLDTEYRQHLSRIKAIMPEPGRNVALLYRLTF